MSTVERAFAKLTRNLRIVGRRDDGYHLIESEMVTLDFADELTFFDAEHSSLEVIDLIAWERDGDRGDMASASIPSDGSNLVLRALALAGRAASVTLRKRIPAGAGLGGGSADAAAALRFASFADPAEAVVLGADVPFCVVGGRAIVRGVGEILEPRPPVPLNFVVVTPAFGVSTAAAYQAFDEFGAGDGENDLERAALTVEPRLATVRDLVREVAGVRPILAGSGSSFFVECRQDRSAALRREIAAAAVTEGVIASVVACAATGPLRAGAPGD
ncbi:MAG TPA: 4-(cytidine 5'-diphospho)-2-C-methyl-D-erythritol kinase [Acidimicrobiales bacterium]|jgi:4-diphosphocytidyl-2-C-methyl-D-erythritol kinase|nr:4-(cytidine 5'-diphospho)-2-C-methyl-D-erythritol kinase [Acidimicrobiales bacterium]